MKTNIELIDFSLEVRNSSSKRFQSIPKGYEHWQYLPNKMSIADLIQHLIDCDQEMIKGLKKKKPSVVKEMSE